MLVIHSLESFLFYGTIALIMLDSSCTTKFEFFTTLPDHKDLKFRFLTEKMKDFVTAIQKLVTK